jgi:hypothetical protein
LSTGQDGHHGQAGITALEQGFACPHGAFIRTAKQRIEIGWLERREQRNAPE